ncbi:hypothetical protein MEQU1_002659 [Malassezia equina]|uniref:CRAL-TRIO domain-containing protein n=1 Tax=Malassezia equina TaxID=1381935 RepID=A0AAF0IZG6_9BASI|nr:hypothetical protein MEQU1_002659 [Malassezia equina]
MAGHLGEQVPEGYRGNLTPTQSQALKEAWTLLEDIFQRNCERSDKLERKGGPKAAQTGEELSANVKTKEDAKASKDSQDQKAIDAAVAKYGGRYLRQSFWDTAKMDAPDQLVLRFLRARKFDVKRSMAMLISAIQFHLDVNTETILFKGEQGLMDVPGFLNQFRRGISYIEGNTDRYQLPIYFIHVARHLANAQKPDTLQQFVVLAMENARLLCTPPIEKCVIVFDMAGFGLKNMDWNCVMFILKCLEAVYPESLQRIYIHGAPWIFKGIWSALQPLMDPDVQAKIRFSSKAQELEEYVPRSRFRKGMGGTLDWDWSYPEPEPGENELQNDTETRVQIQREYRDLCEQFEKATHAWIQGDESMEYRREVLTRQLRLKYYQMAPFVRAVTVYSRTKVLRNDFTVQWTYPQLDGSVQSQTINERHNVPALLQWLRDHDEDTLEDSIGGQKSPCMFAGDSFSPADAKTKWPSKQKESTKGASKAADASRKQRRKPVPQLDGDRASLEDETSTRSGSSTPQPNGVAGPEKSASLSDAEEDKPGPPEPNGSTVAAAGVAAGATAGVAAGVAANTQSDVPSYSDAEDLDGFESAEEFTDEDDMQVEEERYAISNEWADNFDLDDDERSLLAEDGEYAMVPETVMTPHYVQVKISPQVCELTDSVLREDLETAHEAMQLFLNSQMREAEELCREGAGTRLYRAAGMSLINMVKSLMTFEPEDMQIAMKCCQHTKKIAGLLRKKKRLSTLLPQSKSVLSEYSLVQQHAELVYAESILCKSIVGTLYAGDTIGLVREAMNLRTAYVVLRDLLRMIEAADQASEPASRDPRPSTNMVDQDLRSGVYFGMGCCMLVLSLLEPRMLRFMEGVGFVGDRRQALRLFERAGGWTRTELEPHIGALQEGARRPLCDIAILLYHLVIPSSVPLPDVDLSLADRVLSWNLHRFPQGTFYLFFSSLLYASQALPEKAVECFRTAIDSQHEYKQLHHLCFWRLSLTYLSMGEYDRALTCYDVLARESNWSKAIYQYAKAALLYEANPLRRAQASMAMKQVPILSKKMAGRHVPFERFVMRKAAKFEHQSMLGLPALEFVYMWNGFAQTPITTLVTRHLTHIDRVLDELLAYKSPNEFAGGANDYYALYSLAYFLRGVALRYVAFPERHTVVRLPVGMQLDMVEVANDAKQSLLKAREHGSFLDAVDRYLVYFAHYELGSLYLAQGDLAKARRELELVESRKPLVPQENSPLKSPRAAYVMSHMCQMRAHLLLQNMKLSLPSEGGGKITRSLSRRIRSLSGANESPPMSTTQRSTAAAVTAAYPASDASTQHYNDIPDRLWRANSAGRDLGRRARSSRLLS